MIEEYPGSYGDVYRVYVLCTSLTKSFLLIAVQ